MEHEVFVPFPPGTVREALRDPARVAHAIPGYQPETSGEPPHQLTGRLRLRIAGSTITYRGAVRLTDLGWGLAVEGEAAEARGSGAVKIAIEVAAAPAEGGAVLTFSGTVRSSGGGRLAEQDAEAVAVAGRRLLDRFAAELTAGLPAAEPDVVDDGAQPAGAADEGATQVEAEAELEFETEPEAEAEAETETEAEAETGAAAEPEPSAAEPEAESASGTDAETEAATGGEGDSGSRSGSAGLPEGVTVPESAAELDPLPDELTEADGEPPAEAAHARRTMIGRSAEEVDHAPPRGRYAPVPAPDAATGRATLRWAAPAAAALIASAVVVGRMLRRSR